MRAVLEICDRGRTSFMKRTVLVTILSVIVSFVFSAAVPATVHAGDAVPAKEAVKYLDKEKYTRAQIRDFYRKLKRKTVKGEGRVYEVKKARRNYEICVMVKDTTYYRPCNLVISTPQKEALKLNKGDRIAFEGEFIRLTPFVNYYVIIKGKFRRK